MKKISFQNMWNDFKALCKRFYEWKIDNLWICILKILSLILAFATFFLFVFKVLPVLAGLAVLFLVLKWANEPTQPQQVLPAYDDTYIARDLLFEALSRAADVLDIIKPGNVNEITPVFYPVSQSVNGHLFYRFIVRAQPEYDEEDFIKKKEMLNIYIGQILQAGFPNVLVPFYRDTPCYTIFKIGIDSHHQGCFYIDIMPVVDDAGYTYLERLKAKEDAPEDSLNLFNMDDEDF